MNDERSDADRSAPEHPHSEAAAWTVLSYLISGPLVYGGLGWLLDLWLGTQFFVAIGILGGMALSFYIIVRRYVSPSVPVQPPPGEQPGRPPTSQH
jgi:ATP synthase protein I